MDIHEVHENKGQTCQKILSALPDWSGIESAVDNYEQQAKNQTMFAAFDGDLPIGMLTLTHHSSWNLEIAAMGVLPEYHRNGVGRKLVATVIAYAQKKQIKALTVKTLSSANPDEGYKLTRAFYDSVGFEPFEEMPDLWDEDNPAMVYILPL